MHRRGLFIGMGAAAAAARPATAAWLEAPASAEIDVRRLSQVDALLQRLVGKGLLPGAAVQISQRGKVLYERVSGWADIGDRRRLDTNTIYRIYSMTKPITAVAIMMLYEDGALLLNDPVAKYVPEFASMRVYAGNDGAAMRTEPARPMSVVNLLTHTSGLSNSWNPGQVAKLYPGVGLSAGAWLHDPRIRGLPDFAERLSRVPLEFQPGTRWLYSYSPDVAGLVVERISGMRFEDFLRSRLFGPLGMIDTAFEVQGDNAGRLASVYGFQSGKLVRTEAAGTSPFRARPSADSGAAGLVSTLADYGRFARMLAGGGAVDGVRILSPAGAALLMSNQVEPSILADGLKKFAPFGLGGAGEGLGFALCGAVVTDVGMSHDLGVTGEYSWGGAASTTFWAAPRQELAVVLMTQLMPSGALPLRDWLKAAVYQALT